MPADHTNAIPSPTNPPPTATSRLQPGTLMARLEAATARGLAAGELLPLDTEHSIVDAAGLRWQVHVLAQLQRKDAARAIQVANKEAPPTKRNPFLPYEPALFVADISETHVAVLNKFNVLPHHMLLITRDFAPQTAPLDATDMAATAQCLQEIDGLAFFNGGEAAGSSQPHKHLQLILLPMTPGEPDTPLSPWLDELPTSPAIQTLPQLPYVHGIRRLPDGWWSQPESATTLLTDAYQALVHHTSPDTKRPYNWLLTRRWMMVVPRSQEFCQSISVNSLGFIGGLLVRSAAAREELIALGPLQILQHVGIPQTKNLF